MEEFESNNPNQGNNIQVEQTIRAELRERFLYLISNLTGMFLITFSSRTNYFVCFLGGRECTVNMYENTKVTCNVSAFDSDFENIVVENLVTPLPVPIKKAILRTNDIISMHFDNVSELKLIE